MVKICHSDRTNNLEVVACPKPSAQVTRPREAGAFKPIKCKKAGEEASKIRCVALCCFRKIIFRH